MTETPLTIDRDRVLRAAAALGLPLDLPATVAIVLEPGYVTVRAYRRDDAGNLIPDAGCNYTRFRITG